MNNKKYRNKIAFIIILLFVSVLIIWNMLNKYDINSRLTFIKDDITKIWVFDDNNHGSYDYKLSNIDAQKISNELVNSKKNVAKKSDKRMIDYSITFLIMLNGTESGGGIKPDRTITIYPRDDNSVYVDLSKKGSRGKSVIIKSTELVDFIKEVKSQFGL